MNEDFEQRLRTLFAATEEPPVSQHFGTAVRERIAGLRRTRRIALAATAGAALAATVLGVQLLAAGTAFVASAPVALNGALGALLASPVGYVLGALLTAAALADAFSE